MESILEARSRYSAFRRELDPDCPLDREILAELTAAIRALDRKLAAAGQGRRSPPTREAGTAARP